MELETGPAISPGAAKVLEIIYLNPYVLTYIYKGRRTVHSGPLMVRWAREGTLRERLRDIERWIFAKTLTRRCTGHYTGRSTLDARRCRGLMLAVVENARRSDDIAQDTEQDMGAGARHDIRQNVHFEDVSSMFQDVMLCCHAMLM